MESLLEYIKKNSSSDYGPVAIVYQNGTPVGIRISEGDKSIILDVRDFATSKWDKAMDITRNMIPNRKQWMMVERNLDKVNKLLEDTGLSSIDDNKFYWSCEECGRYDAYVYRSYFGSLHKYPKTNNFTVRRIIKL